MNTEPNRPDKREAAIREVIADMRIYESDDLDASRLERLSHHWANKLAAALRAPEPQGAEPVAWGAWSEGDPTRLVRYDGQPAVSHSRSDFYNVPLYPRPPVEDPVACDVVRPDGALVAQRVDIEYADELLREWKWGDCHKANFLYAYKGVTK